MARLLLALLCCGLLAAGETDPLAGVRIDEATLVGTPGFFRVGKATNGRWWLVDPAGKPFFYKGAVAVNRSGLIGGRWAKGDGPYAAAVDKRYGDRAAFVKGCLDRLRSWNFNGLGAWTTEEFFEQGMAYTEVLMLNFLSDPAQSKAMKLPDVHDPAWIAAVDALCAKLCAPRKDSKQLIGYYTDNELSWYAPMPIHPEARLEGGFLTDERAWLLQNCLMLDAGRPAWTAAWDFVLKRHGDLAGVARAWGVPIADRATPRAWTVKTLVRVKDPATQDWKLGPDGKPITEEKEVSKCLATPGYLKDCADWVRDYARRYLEITSAAVRKHDPNHLVLGTRFGGNPGELVLSQFKRPLVDVVSFNTYWSKTTAVAEGYFAPTGMPLIVGEYAWVSSRYIRTPPEPPKPVDLSQVEKVKTGGPPALERLIAHPGVVGYTWYRWVDMPDHRPPFGYGLVMIDDQPNTLHTDLLTQVNARAEAIAAATDPAAPREKWEPTPIGAPPAAKTPAKK